MDRAAAPHPAKTDHPDQVEQGQLKLGHERLLDAHPAGEAPGTGPHGLTTRRDAVHRGGRL
jgi:hypothetical protein